MSVHINPPDNKNTPKNMRSVRSHCSIFESLSLNIGALSKTPVLLAFLCVYIYQVGFQKPPSFWRFCAFIFIKWVSKTPVLLAFLCVYIYQVGFQKPPSFWRFCAFIFIKWVFKNPRPTGVFVRLYLSSGFSKTPVLLAFLCIYIYQVGFQKPPSFWHFCAFIFIKWVFKNLHFCE